MSSSFNSDHEICADSTEVNVGLQKYLGLIAAIASSHLQAENSVTEGS